MPVKKESQSLPAGEKTAGNFCGAPKLFASISSATVFRQLLIIL